MNHDTDPIIGDWQFPNNNIMSFSVGGHVMLCGHRVALWKRVKDRNYVIAYLRGQFGGASDPLQIQEDGKSLLGLANGNETRQIERADSLISPECIIGDWDFKNGNIVTFTEDGWKELCGLRTGFWVSDGRSSFLLVYLRGYFGGASDPLMLSEDGQAMRGLINGCWETSTVERANSTRGNRND